MKCIACDESTRYDPYMPVYQLYDKHNHFIGDFHPDCWIESLLASGEVTLKKAEELYERNRLSRENFE